jgi:RNA polymerase sigma factor (sigma-70 family)
MTDYTLIQNCQKNERGAQRQLFELNYGRMMALCMRYARNKEQAKDMLSKGFIKLCADITEYRKEQEFDSWMLRKMSEYAVRYLRDRRQEYYVTTTVRISGEEAPAEFDLFHQQLEPDQNVLTTEQYVQALQLLPPSFRAVYNLCVIEAYTVEDTAKLLEISADTCRYNLGKAKTAFYKNLQHLQSAAA